MDTEMKDFRLPSGEESAQLRREKKARERQQKTVRSHRILRFLVQLAALLLMPTAFLSGFSGVKTLFLEIGEGVPLTMDLNGKVLLFLLVYTVIFGRFFCGYLCAFGSIGDWIYALFSLIWRKLAHQEDGPSLPPAWVRWLQKAKYILLGGILFAAVYGVSFGEGSSPWKAFEQLIHGVLPPAVSRAGLICLILIAVGSAVSERFFCQFLCPLGALFALLPIFPFALYEQVTGRKQEAEKVQCAACLELTPDNDRSGECYSCGKCAAACRNHTIVRGEDTLIRNDVANVLLRAGIFLIAGILLGIGVFA